MDEWMMDVFVCLSFVFCSFFIFLKGIMIEHKEL